MWYILALFFFFVCQLLERKLAACEKFTHSKATKERRSLESHLKLMHAQNRRWTTAMWVNLPWAVCWSPNSVRVLAHFSARNEGRIKLNAHRQCNLIDKCVLEIRFRLSALRMRAAKSKCMATNNNKRIEMVSDATDIPHADACTTHGSQRRRIFVAANCSDIIPTKHRYLRFSSFFLAYLCTMHDYAEPATSFPISFNSMQIICKYVRQYVRARVCVCVFVCNQTVRKWFN